ncbi:MAG: bifunctional folylpolyglutamate synthase/dihydrofolate synthase [Flavobacteriales bacterium]|nr:bifunctional folylpolyglutamate synthase/dihydrofolate synthase [Flavobacteriales bacterium]
MNYQETLDYLFSQLPMYQRQGAVAFKKDLTNTLALCELLDNPHRKFKSIHVAGTNGKGSVSHMLASVFQSAGYKTGLYTSPHLRDFRERIKINGELIPEKSVIDFVESHRVDFEHIQPSFFEMTVALAFHHFAKNEVDIAIIEVGLGGRLDSTNVITPELSVITNIGYDHQQFLGETLPEIAGEKAGVIKPNVPVVIGEFQQEVAEVFERKARVTGSRLRFANREWEIRDAELLSNAVDDYSLKMKVRHYDGLELEFEGQLTGPHQKKNLITVLEVIRTLGDSGWNLTRNHFKDGVKTVVDRTGLMGRWQILQREPLIIADTAHNREGLEPNLNRLLSNRKEDQLHFVWGMVNDKDVSKTLNMLPKEANYYLCKPDVPRGLAVSILSEKASEIGLKYTSYSTVREALEAAKSKAKADDIIYVGGSTFVVAEVV